ncbi:hypothetical protein ACHMXK_01735 [Polaromonas sp. UC242_47]
MTLFSTLLAALLALAACSPTFNWREVRPENTRLSLLLPCKPDKAQKTVPLGGQTAQLSMLGCDAGGATFAVAVADMGDAAHTGAALAQWQSLTLANMKAGPVGSGAGATQVLPFKAPGLAPGLQAVLVKAQGRRADGSAVSGQAVYFVQGAQVFQVVLYASQVSPEVAETFSPASSCRPRHDAGLPDFACRYAGANRISE